MISGSLAVYQRFISGNLALRVMISLAKALQHIIVYYVSLHYMIRNVLHYVILYYIILYSIISYQGSAPGVSAASQARDVRRTRILLYVYILLHIFYCVYFIAYVLHILLYVYTHIYCFG